MPSDKEKKVPFILTRAFWRLDSPAWRAPRFQEQPLSKRTHVFPPESLENLCNIRARTWEPERFVAPRVPKKKTTSPPVKWKHQGWGWAAKLPLYNIREVSQAPVQYIESEAVPQPVIEEQQTPIVPSAPPSPAFFSFYYRRSFDALNSDLAPYSAHAIQLGDRSFRTIAHLYWTIAFNRSPKALKAISDLNTVADHDESIAHLLRIAIHFLDSQTDEFLTRRLNIMFGLQVLKFCQHDDLLKTLLETGDMPLHYNQTPALSEHSNTQLLQSLAAQLSPETFRTNKYGEFGQPLSSHWCTLEHPEDIFWGVDPILDPLGETSNHLILMDIRQRCKNDRVGTLELSKAIAAMLATSLRGEIVVESSHRRSMDEEEVPELLVTGNALGLPDDEKVAAEATHAGYL